MRAVFWLVLPFAALAILGPAHLAIGAGVLLLGVFIGTTITFARRTARAGHAKQRGVSGWRRAQGREKVLPSSTGRRI